jgi:hypothetical protein
VQSDIKLVQDSFRRCDQELGFIDSFYQDFLIESPVVAEKFVNTDMDHQAIILRASLELLIDSHDDQHSAAHLKKVTDFHGRKGVVIESRLYDVWLEVLIATVRKFDSCFDERLESAWRNFMQSRISIIRDNY